MAQFVALMTNNPQPDFNTRVGPTPPSSVELATVKEVRKAKWFELLPKSTQLKAGFTAAAVK
jgi:hypothetical protein